MVDKSPLSIRRLQTELMYWVRMGIGFVHQWMSQRKKVERYYKISFCITCMNRLHHIQKTLPKNIRDNRRYPNIEFVLLDYNSENDLEEWVKTHMREHIEKGILRYIKTDEPEYFHMAHAKNMAHKHATGDIVCNLDADQFTRKDFAHFINNAVNKDPNCIGAFVEDLQEKQIDKPHQLGCTGRIFLQKEHFELLGGYDESFKGWGKDDKDFLQRANMLGLTLTPIPQHYKWTIPHGDHERSAGYPDDLKKIYETRKSNREKMEKNIREKRTRVNKDGWGLGEVRVAVFDPATASWGWANPILQKDELWGVTAYFNPAQYKSRKENYKQFRENSKNQGLKLIAVELAIDDAPFELTQDDADILIQKRGSADNMMWQKERLLNIGIQNLPDSCAYVAWIDGDVLFENEHWIVNAIIQLQEHDVVQLYSEVIRLPEGACDRSDLPQDIPRGSIEGHRRSGYVCSNGSVSGETGDWGFAWAAKRKLLQKYGLFDASIVGGGDLLITDALCKELPSGQLQSKIREKFPMELQQNFENWKTNIQNDMNGGIGFVTGTILHLWHGSSKNRSYREREKVLRDNLFDPYNDIVLQDDLWKWNTSKPELHTYLREYFFNRKEDSKIIQSWKQLNAEGLNGLPSRHRGLILDKQKSIYIAIPKVANSSIKNVLREYFLFDTDDEGNKKPRTVGLHALPENYRSFYKFVFVRNPWDRLLSCYKSKIKEAHVNRGEMIHGVFKGFVMYGSFFGGMSFEEFVHAVSAIPDEEANSHFRSQYTFVTDQNGEMTVDFVGKFETLQQDFDTICSEIGIPSTSILNINKSEHAHYSSYYNEKLIDVVANRYAKDIELFDYVFERESVLVTA